MKTGNRVQIVWLVLMGSFLVCASVALFWQDDVKAYWASRSMEAMLAQAKYLDSAGRAEEASAVFSTLTARYPRREQVLVAYAQHLEAQERYTEAESHYAEAASLGHQRFSAVRRYASFLERRGRADGAVSVYENYLARYPEDKSAQYDLGLRLSDRGRRSEAIACFEVAASDAAFALNALGRLGELYLSEGDPAKAGEVWQRVASAADDPQHAVYWQDVAEARERMKDWLAAEEAWKKFSATFPCSLKAMERLRQFAEQRGDPAECEELRLREAALRPPVECVMPTSAIQKGAIVVRGCSKKLDTLEPGATAILDIYLEFGSTIPRGQAPAIRFRLVPEGGDDIEARTLSSEPSSLGQGPLWRGDMERVAFAIQIPSDVERGSYGLVCEAGPDFEPLFEVGHVAISAPAPAAPTDASANEAPPASQAPPANGGALP